MIKKDIGKETDFETKKDEVASAKKASASKKVSSAQKGVKEKESVEKKVATKTSKNTGSTNKTTATVKTSKKTSSASKTTEKVDLSLLNAHNMKLFHSGKHLEAYKMLGAHIVTEKGKKGVRFTTWAPNAKNIIVSGDFNSFSLDSNYSMKRVSKYGLWSIFVEGIEAGVKYKYAIEDNKGNIVYKCDPYALESEVRPQNASIVHEVKNFKWTDGVWINKRKKKNMYESPLNIYELHLGSWRRKDGEFMTYEEISEQLPDYIEEMGYTHVEMMPLVEHPLDASWGYQGTGYFSVTSRYGSLEGLKTLINALHKRNIGVIIDWVPGHFCKDSHGLYMFDGTPTYEYQEFWRANNGGWGTFNFDLGRNEVKSFLFSNAVFWIEEFHIDGIRVDAVSNILYLDYGRRDGEWKPNINGGKENLQGIEFLRDVNAIVRHRAPGVMMIAEESTAWPNVCREEGLGFNFKWNMGWMNDVLEYVKIDPYFRSMHHGKMNFAMMYNYSENYILPLSHDEVVHGKCSIVNKMFGDNWKKFAGARTLYSYMIGHPGKKLNFMGNELGQGLEWREYEQLEWHLLDSNENCKGIHECIKDLNHIYKEHKCLWELDHDPFGFKWIAADDSAHSIFSFIRRNKKEDDILIFICNFTPNVYYDYKVGVPYKKNYVEIFNSDSEKYGGSGQVMGDIKLVPEKEPCNNFDYSINIKVPPMGAVILAVDKRRKK